MKAGSPSFQWKKLKRPDLDAARGQRCRDLGERLVGSERAPHGRPITNSAWSRASQSLVRLRSMWWRPLFRGVAMVFVVAFDVPSGSHKTAPKPRAG